MASPWHSGGIKLQHLSNSNLRRIHWAGRRDRPLPEPSLMHYLLGNNHLCGVNLARHGYAQVTRVVKSGITVHRHLHVPSNSSAFLNLDSLADWEALANLARISSNRESHHHHHHHHHCLLQTTDTWPMYIVISYLIYILETLLSLEDLSSCLR